MTNTKTAVSDHPLLKLKKAFLDGEIDRWEYIDQRHQYNQILSWLSTSLENTDISSIHLTKGELVFTTKKDGLQLTCNGIDRRVAPLDVLNFGSYEEEENQFASSVLTPGSVVFDVGANIGWNSLTLNSRVKDLKIYAFEPIYETFKYLLTNITLNRATNITCYNVALSNQSGVKDFYFFPSASVLASEKNLLNSKKAAPITCSTHTLDDIVAKLSLERLDFIKCDVEGAELYFLEGGKKSFTQLHPIIQLEICQKWLDCFGYDASDISNYLKKQNYRAYFLKKNKLYELLSFNNHDNYEDNNFNFFFLHDYHHKDIINTYKGN